MFAINFNINRGVKVIMEINILNKAGQFVGIRPHLNVRWPQFTLNKDVWWSHYCVSLKVMSQRNGHWLRELRLPLNSGIKMSQSAIYQSSASNMWTKNFRIFYLLSEDCCFVLSTIYEQTLKSGWKIQQKQVASYVFVDSFEPSNRISINVWSVTGSSLHSSLFFSKFPKKIIFRRRFKKKEQRGIT